MQGNDDNHVFCDEMHIDQHHNGSHDDRCSQQFQEFQKYLLDGPVECFARFLSIAVKLRDENMLHLGPQLVYEPPTGANRVQQNQYRAEYLKKQRKQYLDLACLGEVLEQEVNYLWTQNTKDLMTSLRDLHWKNVEMKKMAISILKDAADFLGTEFLHYKLDPKDCIEGNNVFMTLYSDTSTYFYRYPFPCTVRGITPEIGGVCTLVAREVKQPTISWLQECDRVFCSIYAIHPNGLDRDESIFDNFLSDLAKSISRRSAGINSSYIDYSESIKPIDLYLTKRYLESVCDRETARCSAFGFHQLEVDVHNLKTTLSVASYNSDPMTANGIILQHWSRIKSVVDAPPAELLAAMGSENFQRVFERLRPVYGKVHSFDVRCRLAKMWAASGMGASARAALHKTIESLTASVRINPRTWSIAIHLEKDSPEFHSKAKEILPLPPYPCADEDSETGKLWFALPRDTTRGRQMLDSLGMRMVLMSTWIRQRLQEGGFCEGVVAKRYAINVGVQVLHQSQYMHEIIDMKRKEQSRGQRVTVFDESVEDLSSEVVEELGVASCELSNLSIMQIMRLFGSSGDLLPMVIKPLCHRTRELVPFNICGPSYTQHAVDVTAFLIKSILSRRQAQGMCANNCPHPLADMLRTIGSVKTWKPENGTLIVTLEDLKGTGRKSATPTSRWDAPHRSAAHPQMREVLDHHARSNGGLVKYTSASKNSKIAYTFDTMMLSQLLQVQLHDPRV